MKSLIVGIALMVGLCACSTESNNDTVVYNHRDNQYFSYDNVVNRLKLIDYCRDFFDQEYSNIFLFSYDFSESTDGVTVTFNWDAGYMYLVDSSGEQIKVSHDAGTWSKFVTNDVLKELLK